MDEKSEKLIKEYEKYVEKHRFKLNPNKKVVCPCVYQKKEIKEQGHCHCFLFVSKEFSG